MLGEHIGSYEILEEIGKGGMATVYRARQASVERDVAVKAIRRDVGDLFGAMLTSAGLAQGYLRTGDTARGKRQVDTCLRFGLRGGSEFWLLLGALVLGEWMIARGDVVEGLAAIDLVRTSAAMDHDLLNDSNAALSFWTDRLKVTPDVLQQGQEHARSLDVHALVDQALQEGQ